jgi:phosphate transport system protein
MLAEKLITLRERLIEMSSLVEAMIEKSVKGLETKNNDLLLEVMEKHEPLVNDLEIELDEQCINLIALYEPKAKDARQILIISKMVGELERIGDHAVNIAQAAQFLIVRPDVKPLVDIPKMAVLTREMLRNSINAFIREDIDLARSILLKDDEVDLLRDYVMRDLIAYMSADPSTTERGVELIRVAANLERAADLSTNICEAVIYMVEGRVVKHHYEDRHPQKA